WPQRTIHRRGEFFYVSVAPIVAPRNRADPLVGAFTIFSSCGILISGDAARVNAPVSSSRTPDPEDLPADPRSVREPPGVRRSRAEKWPMSADERRPGTRPHP